MRSQILAMAAALAFAAPAAAQRMDSARAETWLGGVCPGNREVQVTTTAGRRIRGYCGPIERTQLRITLAAREQGVPFDSIGGIWVRKRGSASGAATGALMGALALASTAVFFGQGLCETEDGCVSDTVKLGLGAAAVGGAAGALLGGVLGHATHVWKRIYPR